VGIIFISAVSQFITTGQAYSTLELHHSELQQTEDVNIVNLNTTYKVDLNNDKMWYQASVKIKFQGVYQLRIKILNGSKKTPGNSDLVLLPSIYKEDKSEILYDVFNVDQKEYNVSFPVYQPQQLRLLLETISGTIFFEYTLLSTTKDIQIFSQNDGHSHHDASEMEPVNLNEGDRVVGSLGRYVFSDQGISDLDDVYSFNTNTDGYFHLNLNVSTAITYTNLFVTTGDKVNGLIYQQNFFNQTLKQFIFRIPLRHQDRFRLIFSSYMENITYSLQYSFKAGDIPLQNDANTGSDVSCNPIGFIPRIFSNKTIHGSGGPGVVTNKGGIDDNDCYNIRVSTGGNIFIVYRRNYLPVGNNVDQFNQGSVGMQLHLLHEKYDDMTNRDVLNIVSDSAKVTTANISGYIVPGDYQLELQFYKPVNYAISIVFIADSNYSTPVRHPYTNYSYDSTSTPARAYPGLFAIFWIVLIQTRKKRLYGRCSRRGLY